MVINKTKNVLHRGFSPVRTDKIEKQGATILADLKRRQPCAVTSLL